MNAQLKPTAMNVLTTGSNASATIINDLVSRMNGQDGGAMKEEQKAAFSKWLERHSNSTASADSLNQSTKVVPAQVKASVAAQQLTQRVHFEAHHADKPANPAVARRNEQPAAKPQVTKAPNKDQTSAASKADRAEEAPREEADSDEVHFATAMGEGSAVVRELQPPQDIQRGDPASMMAWLNGLAQSDAKLALAQADAKEAGLGKSEGRDGNNASVAALQAFLSGRGGVDAAHLGQGKAEANGGIDIGGWQAAQSMAQLSLQSALQGETRTEGLGTDPLAGLAAAQTQQLTRSETGANVGKHVTETLSTPVTSPQFADELADKVRLFVSKAQDDGPMTAELHLNPAEMGPINVRIAIDGQTAQVDFAAAAQETRKAIEASLSMLSSKLDEVGLSLTGGGVSSQTPQQGFNQSFGQSDGSSRGAGETRINRVGEMSEEPMGRPISVARLTQKGGLDLYA